MSNVVAIEYRPVRGIRGWLWCVDHGDPREREKILFGAKLRKKSGASFDYCGADLLVEHPDGMLSRIRFSSRTRFLAEEMVRTALQRHCAVVLPKLGFLHLHEDRFWLMQSDRSLVPVYF